MAEQTKPPNKENEMLSKTRTTIITAVAAFTFGGAAIVPTVAQARIKKPAGMSHKTFCAMTKSGNEASVEQYENAENEQEREHAAKEAAEIRHAARQAHCGWASLELSAEAIRPEGTPQGAPEAPKSPTTEGMRPSGTPQNAPESAPVTVLTAAR
jgi:hypothetical protein